MPYDLLARTLASMDVPLPDALSSGAPHYTLPPQADCAICFRAMTQRNVGGLLVPIYKAVCPRCEPLDALTLPEAEAAHKGAVVSLPNIHMKAHG